MEFFPRKPAARMLHRRRALQCMEALSKETPEHMLTGPDGMLSKETCCAHATPRVAAAHAFQGNLLRANLLRACYTEGRCCSCLQHVAMHATPKAAAEALLDVDEHVVVLDVDEPARVFDSKESHTKKTAGSVRKGSDNAPFSSRKRDDAHSATNKSQHSHFATRGRHVRATCRNCSTVARRGRTPSATPWASACVI